MTFNFQLSEETRAALDHLASYAWVRLQEAVAEAAREIEEQATTLTKQFPAWPPDVPGEYHPTGTVVEGSAVYPIEDEQRLLNTGMRVSEKSQAAG